MKKHYQSNKRKKHRQHRNRISQKRKKRYDPTRLKVIPKAENSTGRIIYAPEKMELFKNTSECVQVYQKLLNRENYAKVSKRLVATLSLENVVMIDYGMICILLAVLDNFNSEKIVFQIKQPKNRTVRDYIKDSGMLNDMYDQHGRKFPASAKSKHLFFSKGSGKLEHAQNMELSRTVRSVVDHLTGKPGHFAKLRTILLEICGNAIEWSGGKKKWLLGVKYARNKVIITVTDLGYGVLQTLYRDFGDKITELNLTRDQVLQRAFEKKYNSKSTDINRNKGLPYVKRCHDQNIISQLKVLTNQVLLDFDEPSNNQNLVNYRSFSGTIYRWEITSDNL